MVSLGGLVPTRRSYSLCSKKGCAGAPQFWKSPSSNAHDPRPLPPPQAGAGVGGCLPGLVPLTLQVRSQWPSGEGGRQTRFGLV